MEELFSLYQKNIMELKKYDSYTNQVREYDNFVFKEFSNMKKLKNEEKWLKKLNQEDYPVPHIYGVYENTIIMEKIEGKAIADDKAHNHLYNIGKLMAQLHNISIEGEDMNWVANISEEYNAIKKVAIKIMDTKIYQHITNFLDQNLIYKYKNNIGIIHRDIRPANIIYAKEKYYLIDFEIMCIGDIDFDFIRIFDLLNQKNIYQYEDFKTLLMGYERVRDMSKQLEHKWEIYDKYYAFKLYVRMLDGTINKDEEYLNYLKNILIREKEHDKVLKWIKKYNVEKS